MPCRTPTAEHAGVVQLQDYHCHRRVHEIGVRQVTIGTSFARAALNAMPRAAHEVLDHGTFGYLEGLPTAADSERVIETGG